MNAKKPELVSRSQGKVAMPKNPTTIQAVPQVILKTSISKSAGGLMLMVRLEVTWATIMKIIIAIATPLLGIIDTIAVIGSQIPVAAADKTPMRSITQNIGKIPKKCPMKLLDFRSFFKYRTISPLLMAAVIRTPTPAVMAAKKGRPQVPSDSQASETVREPLLKIK